MFCKFACYISYKNNKYFPMRFFVSVSYNGERYSGWQKQPNATAVQEVLEDAMTKAMFSERERSNGSYLIANANRLQYMTTKQKVEMAQQMLDRGVMSINEARELFNYAPVDGGDLRTIRGEYKDSEEIGGNNNASENE